MAGRMLLAHNYTLADSPVAAQVIPLSRSEFAAVFTTQLAAADVDVAALDHPHWMVEVRFSEQQSPLDIGLLCVEALQALRSQSIDSGMALDSGMAYTVLALGGLKATPATSSNPAALQTGEWGVDMVETVAPDDFLAMIGWEATIATRSPDTYFQHRRIVSD